MSSSRRTRADITGESEEEDKGKKKINKKKM
jgi:hypothetical protein